MRGLHVRGFKVVFYFVTSRLVVRQGNLRNDCMKEMLDLETVHIVTTEDWSTVQADVIAVLP